MQWALTLTLEAPCFRLEQVSLQAARHVLNVGFAQEVHLHFVFLGILITQGRDTFHLFQHDVLQPQAILLRPIIQTVQDVPENMFRLRWALVSEQDTGREIHVLCG